VACGHLSCSFGGLLVFPALFVHTALHCFESLKVRSFAHNRPICRVRRGCCFSRTRLPFAVSDQRVLNRRLSLCSPASLETYQREHRELALRRPVGLTADLARNAPNKSSQFAATFLRGDVTRLYHLKIPVLAAMKRMETTLDAMKLCAPTVHQIN
jgi:hypothetical protein